MAHGGDAVPNYGGDKRRPCRRYGDASERGKGSGRCACSPRRRSGWSARSEAARRRPESTTKAGRCRCGKSTMPARRRRPSKRGSARTVEDVEAQLLVAAIRQWRRGTPAIGGDGELGFRCCVGYRGERASEGERESEGEERGARRGILIHASGSRRGRRAVERERARATARGRYSARRKTTGTILQVTPWPFYFPFIQVLFLFIFCFLFKTCSKTII